jgi:hypothetical protein
MGLPEGPPRRGSPAHIGNPRKRNPYIPGDLHELDVRGLQSYTTQLGPGWSDRVRALKEQGLTHRDALAQVIESHFKQRKNPSTGAGKVTYIVSVTGPTGSESFPYYGFDKGKADIALREAEGLPKGFKVRFMEWKHGALRPKMITSGNRKNPATRGMSESKARQWVRDTLKIDGSAPYPGRIGPAMQAKLGWAFQVTFRNAQWGKQKGFGPEFDRWYLVGIDQDGHEFLQLTRPESIFGLRDKPSGSHR